MRDKREDKYLDLSKYGAEDRVIVWALTHASRGFENGFISTDITESINSHITTTCRLLKELVDDDVLVRNRVHGRWSYRVKNYHDPDDYLLHKEARNEVSQTISSYKANFARLKNKYEALEEFGKNHEIFVSCECGRRMGFKLVLKEVHQDDSSKGCDEGDRTIVSPDTILGFQDSQCRQKSRQK